MSTVMYSVAKMSDKSSKQKRKCTVPGSCVQKSVFMKIFINRGEKGKLRGGRFARDSETGDHFFVREILLPGTRSPEDVFVKVVKDWKVPIKGQGNTSLERSDPEKAKFSYAMVIGGDLILFFTSILDKRCCQISNSVVTCTEKSTGDVDFGAKLCMCDVYFTVDGPIYVTLGSKMAQTPYTNDFSKWIEVPGEQLLPTVSLLSIQSENVRTQLVIWHSLVLAKSKSFWLVHTFDVCHQKAYCIDFRSFDSPKQGVIFDFLFVGPPFSPNREFVWSLKYEKNVYFQENDVLSKGIFIFLSKYVFSSFNVQIPFYARRFVFCRFDVRSGQAQTVFYFPCKELELPEKVVLNHICFIFSCRCDIHDVCKEEFLFLESVKDGRQVKSVVFSHTQCCGNSCRDGKRHIFLPKSEKGCYGEVFGPHLHTCFRVVCHMYIRNMYAMLSIDFETRVIFVFVLHIVFEELRKFIAKVGDKAGLYRVTLLADGGEQLQSAKMHEFCVSKYTEFLFCTSLLPFTQSVFSCQGLQGFTVFSQWVTHDYMGYFRCATSFVYQAWACNIMAKGVDAGQIFDRGKGLEHVCFRIDPNRHLMYAVKHEVLQLPVSMGISSTKGIFFFFGNFSWSRESYYAD